MSTYGKRLYFDNAATSFPKPACVLEAMRDYFERIGASAGRGSYREAIEGGRIVAGCRQAVGRLFGCDAGDHVIFGLNGTDALNLALKGAVPRGGHVVTTVMDHNSVLRPLSAMQDRAAVSWTAVRADPESTRVEPADIRAALRPETALVAVNHASNVTGMIQPIDDIGEICREAGVPLLVDAAQTAGHIPINFARQPIDLLACPGHKGLLGPSGTGVLVIRRGIEERMQSVREGGTGSASEHPFQPENLPDKLEAGSHNSMGLAGLLAGVEWLLERGIEAVREHELRVVEVFQSRMEPLCNGSDGAAKVRMFGPREPRQRVGVFSLRIAGCDPAELSVLLEEQFGVLTRSGLHCAPLAHRTIGTDADGGTTRISSGPFLSEADVEHAAQAIASLTETLAADGVLESRIGDRRGGDRLVSSKPAPSAERPPRSVVG